MECHLVQVTSLKVGQARSLIVCPLPSGVRLGAAQWWLADRPPLRDEPCATGRRHRDVLGRHDRLLLLRQKELAQQQIDRLIYDTLIRNETALVSMACTFGVCESPPVFPCSSLLL